MSLIYVSSMDTSNGHFTIRYLAESDAISEGVNKIYLRQRIDKHRLGSSTWTPVATIPVDTKQSMASYIEEGARCATNNIIPSVSHYDDNHLYLGSMDGAIHDLSLFNIYRDVNDAAATKYQAKDNYVYGLANYWPLKEGHGHVAADTRHTHDFEVNDSWMLENENYSLRLDDNKGVEADISRINTSVGDSYAIEMWVHASNPDSDGDEQIVFEAGSVPSNRLELYINNQDDWLLRYGNNEQVVVSHEDFPYMPTWAHVALNVVRGQAASFYFNGERTAVIAERNVPPLEGARLTMGRGMGTLSQIDEVRVWHAALSENRLLSNMYNCIDTTDVYSRGLVAYYPFEKAGTVDGVATKVPTLENLAPQASQSSDPSSSLSPLGEYLATSDTPPLKNAPVETRIIAKPVASERKVVISLLEGGGIKARDVEGTTLNITVDKILDMHGNQSLPIRWQAYVQCNALKWTKDSVNVFMKYGDGCTFDVNIENKGGVTEYYTLYNMPEWLSLIDSESTDDISPLKTKTLRFAVSPLTPVGCYDITIGLQGNNAILEPLRIVLKVQSEQPAWTVDPTAYENSMTIVAQVYLDGHLMENGESIVAAFIDGECRGIASPVMATMPIDFALAGAHPQIGDRIKSQTAFAIFGHNGVWEGELKALENGQGYMYYSTDVSKKTFTWPVLSSIASARMAVTTLFRSSSRTVEGAGAFNPVSPTNYSDNMTMVIRLVASESSETFVNVDTCEVAAFVDGECRGASRSDGGLYYLLIAGEGSGTPIELRICIDGQIVSIDNKLTFSTDANIGTPWNPYVIDLTGVQAIQDVRYSGSGSVETLYDLQGRKMDSRKLRQGVYIRNGKKLVVGDRSSIEK